jgi:multidrug efflux pump subunit AcrA (membrane-fusion protein)
MTITRLLVLAVPAMLLGCTAAPPANLLRVSGYVETTEVQAASEVGGRILELRAAEGDRVEAGAALATIDTEDQRLQIDRTRAERAISTS